MSSVPCQNQRDRGYYVPIAPEHLGPAMDALVRFIRDGGMRPLIRTALVHVEFEALHPFQDGNGRIGRMLITLMLWKLGIIGQPPPRRWWKARRLPPAAACGSAMSTR